jgi:hypothetical protein
MKMNFLAASAWRVLAMAIMALILVGVTCQNAAALATGNIINIAGTDSKTLPANLSSGVYFLRGTGGGGFLSIAIKDKADEVLYINAINNPASTKLVIVGDESFKPGDVVFEIDAMGPWTVTMTKADDSAAVALPQALAGAELEEVISKPFKVAAGNLVVSYTCKAEPQGTGTILFWNIATGKIVPLSVAQAIYPLKTSGEWTVMLPETGVYIAQTTFPKGSSGGEVKLSQ